MATLEHAQPFNAFAQGRAVRQDEDYANSRNALARMEVEQEPARQQRANKLADLQVQGAEQGLDADKAKYAYTTLMQAKDSGNPKAFILQNVPDLVSNLRKQGIDLSSMDDQGAAELVDNLARSMAGKAGIAPAKPETMTPYQKAQIDLEERKLAAPKTMSPYEQARIDIENKKLGRQPSGPKYRTLTPEEVAAAGLPPGTSAQQDDQGKIDVLSKRDNSGALSQKDISTARNKLTQLKIARQQLERIKTAYNNGTSGVNAFGPGQGLLPTEQGKQFDGAVDQMRSTLTALTRVPGVGSMSDYESRLDQGKFPNRNEYESVTAQKIQGIEDLISTLESGYGEMLNGSAPQESTQPAPQSGQPVQVRSVQEAMSLPPGTVFITPDGRQKVR
jgi:hypothetical protein